MMTTKISRPGAPGGERAQDEPMMDFTQSFDARDWARAFVDMVRVKPSIATDEGTMLGWFANALMRGWDEHAKRYPNGDAKVETPDDIAPVAERANRYYSELLRRDIECSECRARAKGLMAKKKEDEPKTYKFLTIEDLHSVSLDQLDAFMIDLKAWLMVQRVAELQNGALVMRSPRDCFEWIDDGKHDVNVTFHVEQRRSDV